MSRQLATPCQVAMSARTAARPGMPIRRAVATLAAAGLALGLAACDPYSPGQRAVGGGLLGAGAGAAIGGIAGGGTGAAIGALGGGALGAGAGAVTTPNR